MVKRSVLYQIFTEMMKIRYRLDEIDKRFSNWAPEPVTVSVSQLLTLPDHLRTTYTTVLSCGECSATLVSNKTGRSRAIESNHLNQLVRMGWLTKRQVSKTVEFRSVPQKTLELPKRSAPMVAASGNEE